MLRLILRLLASSTIVLAGCSPTHNWREVRWVSAELKLLLPCKPDQGSRRMTLAGRDVEIEMMGCEAGSDLFAIAHVQLGDAGSIATVQAHWQTVMLGNMQAQGAQRMSFQSKGASAQPAPVRLSAQGRRPDGSAVMAQGVWFARGPHLYHAVIFADKISLEAAETFFSGIELQ
jgi:hypothetical protein